MTNPGAFGIFYDAHGSFTLYSVQRGGHNQTTGVRIPDTKTSTVIKGALDPMTEEDLKTYGIMQLGEGQFKFWTEESYNVRPGDLIKEDSSGRLFRVITLLNRAPLVRWVMGGNADPIGFSVELTKEGRP